MLKIRHILYFCAGNTCRSPFAEFFSKWMKNVKFKEELKSVEFDSAGIYHYYKTAQPGTVAYLKSLDIEIGNFKTKRIDAQLLEKQDLILGFEQKHHINKLKRKFKGVKNLDKKTYLLLDFADQTGNLEIEDPFNLEQSEYNLILKRIENGVIKIISKIIKINKSGEIV